MIRNHAQATGDAAVKIATILPMVLSRGRTAEDLDQCIEEYESLNVRDLDTLDNNVAKDIYKELEDGSKFSLMLAHIIGVDSAGHTYNA